MLAGWEGRCHRQTLGSSCLMEGADPIVRSGGRSGDWFAIAASGVVGLELAGHALRRRHRGARAAHGARHGSWCRSSMRPASCWTFRTLADESAREALQLFEGPVVASHSNPRKPCATPTGRSRTISSARSRTRGTASIGSGAVQQDAGGRMDATDTPGRPCRCKRVGRVRATTPTQVAGTHHGRAAIGSDLGRWLRRGGRAPDGNGHHRRSASPGRPALRPGSSPTSRSLDVMGRKLDPLLPSVRFREATPDEVTHAGTSLIVLGVTAIGAALRVPRSGLGPAVGAAH